MALNVHFVEHKKEGNPLYLHVDEVAKELRCSKKSIYRKLKAGDLEGYKPGRSWLISRESVQKLLEKHSNAKTNERRD